MNEKPRFQLSLQRLIVSTAVFAVLFGTGLACVRVDREESRLIGGIFLQMSVFIPIGCAINGWRGGVWALGIMSWCLPFTFLVYWLLND